jgi:hypothetical protein
LNFELWHFFWAHERWSTDDDDDGGGGGGGSDFGGDGDCDEYHVSYFHHRFFFSIARLFGKLD